MNQALSSQKNGTQTEQPTLQKLTLTYTVGICRRKEFQGKQLNSTYMRVFTVSGMIQNIKL